jgi:hypothetical protein
MMRKAALLCLIVGASTAALSCSDAPGKGDKFDRKVGTRASPGSFRKAGVSAVFEKRCGSLDCHGTPDRSLRIYSSSGLRLPADPPNTPGSGVTTLDEVTANYQSLMNLEPERTNDLIAGGDPYQMLIVKKPLELEKHKGGPALKSKDVAERCIISWLTEDPALTPIDAAACGDAARFPKE